MHYYRPICTVGEVTSYTFPFKNPFGHPIVLDILLRDSTTISSNTSSIAAPTVSPLSLLLKKVQGVVVGPYATLQIPLAFAPQAILERCATVEVRAASSSTANSSAVPVPLVWVYPIRGVAEAPAVVHAFELNIQAKTTVRRTIDVVLGGLVQLCKDPDEELFTYELVLLPSAGSTRGSPKKRTGGSSSSSSANNKLLEQSFTVAPLRTSISDCAQPLQFQLTFEPLKPFTAVAELIVQRATANGGGLWRFGIDLTATEPEPDDSFQLQAAVGSYSSVALRLCNRWLSYAPFEAYFTPDSALSFSVECRDAVLAPFGTEGTLITVTYAPTEYSHTQRGRLVVVTDDIQWSYEVTGAFPAVRSLTL
jgi:hypothetical protein